MATATPNREDRDRLAVLEACGVFDEPDEPSFDFLAELAAETCNAPMAAISLIAADRLWFKSAIGIPFREISREDSLCQHILARGGPMVIENAAAEKPYCESPLVTGELAIRHYAGAPLVTEDGLVLGSLCIAGTEPKTLTESQVRALTALADQVVALIERRRSEARLKQTVRRLEDGERLALVGAWEWDVQADVVEWTRGMYRIWGIGTDAEVSFDLFAESLHPDDRERVLGIVGETAENGGTFEYRTRIVRPDGEIREIEAEGEADVNADGDVTVVRGAAWDITEEQKAERELLMRAQLLDHVDAAAVIGMDLERKITHWNHGAELLFGWKREEVMDRPAAALGLVHGETEKFRRAMARSIGEGRNAEGEVIVRRRDGSTTPTFSTMAAVTEPGGETIGYVGVSVDITDRKEHESEIRESRLETVRRLARAVEMRDVDTGGHIERIGEYAASIGDRLGLDRDRVELLRISSPMHDVGKIGISDAILLKPGTLTPQERSEMERHTQIGHDLLAGSGSEFLDLAAVIALAHHEWVDGSGYPNGLAGDEIPVEGRIVAVADVYDALTSDRVYRKAFEHDEALEMMAAERGTHFDPEALDALLAILRA